MVIDNLLIRPGKLVMRNPIDLINDLSIYAPINIGGYVGGDYSNAGGGSWWQLGQKIASATAAIDPWNVPLIQPSSATRLASASTTQIYFNVGVDNTVVVGTVDQVPGPRWINYNGTLYGIGYDTATAPAASIVGYLVKPVQLLSRGLNTGAALLPSVIGGAPQGAIDLKGFLTRVWLLGGCDSPAGSVSFSPNTLFFSNPTSGLSGSPVEWRDPISGNTNYITIDNNTHDYGVGLATTRAGLMILRHSSIYLLRGTTTANFAVQIVSREVGCVDARSILETDGGVYFMSHKGLMMANGTSVKNVSGTVQQTLQAAIAFQQRQIISGSNCGYVSCGLLSDGQILVSIGYQVSSATGLNTPIWSGMFDPAMNVWTRVTSQIWTAENPLNTQGYPGMLLSRPDNRQLFSVDKKYIAQLEDLPNTGRSIVRVAQTSVSPGAFYDKSYNATPYLSIPATWVTKYGSLAMSTHKRAQANRYYLDYTFQSASLNGSTGYAITPIDGFGAAFPVGTASVPAVAPSTTSYIPRSISIPYGLPVLQHYNNDFVSELTNDMAFSISWSDVAQAARPVSGLAELYGVGVEFQPTSDRR